MEQTCSRTTWTSPFAQVTIHQKHRVSSWTVCLSHWRLFWVLLRRWFNNMATTCTPEHLFPLHGNACTAVSYGTGIRDYVLQRVRVSLATAGADHARPHVLRNGTAEPMPEVCGGWGVVFNPRGLGLQQSGSCVGAPWTRPAQVRELCRFPVDSARESPGRCVGSP